MFWSTSAHLAVILFLASKGFAQPFNCQITVPPNPLTAEGLATPYKQTGCNQIDFADQGNFVEATIIDTATGALQVYHPLIINQDQDVAGVDFIPPVVPTLSSTSVVGITFGSNANTITLVGDTNGCVNGLDGSVFGQFAYCNSPAWFTAAEAAVTSGLLTVTPPGTATIATGQACPVTRDFRVVDMDQSDNVDSMYLLINGTVLAQNTAANAGANKNSTIISNGSDNLLINDFIAPTMGCTPFTAPSITTPSGISPSMLLNELQGQLFPPAGGPALVPLNDDFAVENDDGTVTQSLTKTNLYRAGVGQPQAADNANASGTTYCQRYAESGIFIASNEALFLKATSPAPGVANNLFTFMANRFATSFGPVPSLGCATIFGVNITNIVQQTVVDCIVTAATIDTAILSSILNGQIQPVTASSATSTATASVSSKATATAASTTSTSTATHHNKGGFPGGRPPPGHVRNVRRMKARNVWAW